MAIADLLATMELTAWQLAVLAGIAFVAGAVRGFSGFALSALVMASAVALLPPVELIPICWCLEMTASLLMARAGIREADGNIVRGLVIGSVIGVPIGLALTTSLPVESSKLVALALILALAAMQLARIRLSFLATRRGLYASGVTAGLATGLASVGGMVVALYVLSQDVAANRMRASLVAYLFISSLFTATFLLFYGVLDATAALRGLVLAAPAAAGVRAGQHLFSPRFAPYYRPFCLALLLVLSGAGLMRLAF